MNSSRKPTVSARPNRVGDVMAVRRRLDTELVRRGLARSREQASELIAAGRVSVSGNVASKPATAVLDSDAVHVRELADDWVSRGAHKLLGALAALPFVDVAGARALDAGASTGGFTQVLLSKGAESVIAVDVGYGQIAWQLRTDPRVVNIERSNIRHMTRSDVPYAPDLVVADLSFISLRTVLPALVDIAAPGAWLVLMVKPQFEVGKDRVGEGVVHDPALREEAVMGVIEAAQAAGACVHGVAASPLPGPKGNVEYFLALSTSVELRSTTEAIASRLAEAPVVDDPRQAVRRAIEEGPRA